MAVNTPIDTGAGLSLHGVTVRYGHTVAVDDVSLVLDPGEVVALLGPSGCGKSTLLRAIAGLEPLAAGSIAAAGRSLDGVPTHQRDLGLMFQEHVLFDHLDVAGNVAYGLERQRRPVGERQARVAELLALVGLDDFDTRRVASLSGGEAQRVALARALAPSPSLLMLDEPLGALDRGRRDELTVVLRRVLRELGQTAVHVTHDQTEAFAVADRVAVMRDGRIVQIAPPDQLWSAPLDRFVAEFVGHRNLVDVDGRTEIWPERAVDLEPTDAQVVDGVADGGPIGTVVAARFDDGEWVHEAKLRDGSTLTSRSTRRSDIGGAVRCVIDRERVIAIAG